ncbi:MAG TPA: site-2 protease family protein [Terriglobales bacterium]|nr:site-2 protease family protein [Terriglobales bacterium]
MQAQIKLGRVFGIRIGLHYSWVIIAILIVFSLSEQFRLVHRDWTPGVVWGTAILTAVLFFVCIVLHELGHSVVAQNRGIRVPSIVLFALGGVSQMERESPDAKTEFWMALAGPLVSFALGLVCLGLAHTMGWVGPSSPAGSPVVAMLAWLGYINLTLGLFNLIPAYPLDGGRVLRAAAWWATHTIERATRIASNVGQVFAFLFILAGLWRFFHGQGFAGLWIAFIGWFLLDAARSSRVQVEIMHALSGIKVRDVMQRDCATIDANTNLQTLVDEHLLRAGQRCFVVVRDGNLAGLVTPADIGRVERRMWPLTTVEQAMRPLAELRVVSPEAPVMQALETMARENINQLPVVSDGHLEGMLSRAHLLEILRARAELKV